MSARTTWAELTELLGCAHEFNPSGVPQEVVRHIKMLVEHLRYSKERLARRIAESRPVEIEIRDVAAQTWALKVLMDERVRAVLAEHQP